ncbi:MAG: hypothetical protein GKR94_26475 [Gammaproteobacteria bacterium]|nr:hypothetical protein [Gammaproteobacteria bacterium]
MSEEPSNAHANAIQWTHTPPIELTLPALDGVRSHPTDGDEARVGRTYARLTALEAVVRSLTCERRRRPIEHLKAERVSAHRWIAVRAYHRLHGIGYPLHRLSTQGRWHHTQLGGRAPSTERTGSRNHSSVSMGTHCTGASARPPCQQFSKGWTGRRRARRCASIGCKRRCLAFSPVAKLTVTRPCSSGLLGRRRRWRTRRCGCS